MTALAAGDLFDGLRVIDADTHLTEPHDLWTSRAPARLRRPGAPRASRSTASRRGPSTAASSAGPCASSVIDRDGNRCRAAAAFISWSFDDAHPAAYDVPTRLAVMDEMGI